MTDKSLAHILTGDSAPVIGDADIGYASALNFKRDFISARINGIFHYFLDNRSGSFDHLASRNKLGKMLR